MDLDYLLRLGQFLFTVAVGLFSISASRKASSKAEAEAVARRMNIQDEKILVLEQRMDHQPDAQQLSELFGEVKAINARLEGVANQIAPLGRAVERMNEYLLNHK